MKAALKPIQAAGLSFVLWVVALCLPRQVASLAAAMSYPRQPFSHGGAPIATPIYGDSCLLMRCWRPIPTIASRGSLISENLGESISYATVIGSCQRPIPSGARS